MSLLQGLFGPPDIEKLEARHNIKGLIAALRYQRDSRVPQAAAKALVEIGKPAVEALITVLGDENIYYNFVEDALGDIGDARAVEPLITKLNRSNRAGTRSSAAYALGKIGDARAVEPLIAALGNESVDENTSDAQARAEAVYALGRIGDARAVEPLIAALGNAYNYGIVIKAAATALGEIADARAVNPLKAARSGSNSEEIASAAAEALEKIARVPGQSEARDSEPRPREKELAQVPAQQNRRLEMGTRRMIVQRGLRPLGNKRRLTHSADEDDYDVSLLLFRDKGNAEKYYGLFNSYARNNPPPFVMEIMLLFIPDTIFAEKYAVVIPNREVDTRPEYGKWARSAILSCNDALRIHNNTDHKYKELHRYVEVVYRWDILVPENFSETSREAEELFRDDPNEGFPPLKVLAKEENVAPASHSSSPAQAKPVPALDAQGIEPQTKTEITRLIALLDGPKAWEAVQALAAIGAPAVPRLLNTLLACYSDQACWRAAQALNQIGSPHVTVAPLIDGLRSKKASVRQWSASVLGEIGTGITDRSLRSRAASSLFACLTHASPDVRRYAADALAAVVSESDRARLVANLKHEDPLVRQGIVAALGKIGAESDVMPLLDCVQDSHTTVRMNAVEALGAIGPTLTDAAQRAKVVSALIHCLMDGQFGVRCHAADALGALCDISAVDVLQKLLNDPDYTVRDHAAKALSRIQSEGEIDS